MKKILITGGNGLVGSEFKSLKYFKINSADCDLRNFDSAKLTLNNDFDGIIHCAAKVGGLGGNINHKGEFFYDNIMINTNVIESARLNGVQRLVAFLSTCVFPDNIEYPLTEDKIHQGAPHYSNDAYAYAKRMADIQIRAYSEQYNLKYTSVIPCNIYGPNDNYNISNGHVIPSLIHKCYIARENNQPLMVWGSGKPLREFIYSEDVAYLADWILHNYSDSKPIILSTSEEISIREIVEIIVDLMNFKGKVIFDSTKPDGQFRKPSDNSKLKSYLPNFKFTSIYEGLLKTINFFESNYAQVRK